MLNPDPMPPHPHPHAHPHTRRVYENKLTDTGMRALKEAWGTRGGQLILVLELGHQFNVGWF